MSHTEPPSGRHQTSEIAADAGTRWRRLFERGRLASAAGLLLVALLLALVLYHVAGVVLEYRDVLRFPFQVDYGEGIVWEQAELIFSRRAYSVSQALPFIVFEYTPLYYVVTRLLALVQPDLLTAGRIVSMVSTLACVPLVAGLVLLAQRRPRAISQVAMAAAAGLLFVCLHAVRNWGFLMRVDMLAIAFGLAGLWVGARADGRFWGTVAALLLCLASVFTKQSQLPAGVAVFLVALLRNPRNAIGAAVLVGSIGVAAVAVLQWATGGGFLLHTVSYNLNVYVLSKVWDGFRNERSSAPFAIAMLFSFGLVAVSVARRRASEADRTWTARAVVLVHFVLAALMLVNLAKLGSAYYYFIDVFSSGCVLIGIALSELRHSWSRAGLAVLLVLGVANLPFRQVPPAKLAESARSRWPVVQLIAASDKPVASDEMALVKRAGKPLIYEPAIVEEMIATKRWDPAPLLDMFRSHAFAFVLTTTAGKAMGGPVIERAVREAYPVLRPVAPDLWMNLPAGSQ